MQQKATVNVNMTIYIYQKRWRIGCWCSHESFRQNMAGCGSSISIKEARCLLICFDASTSKCNRVKHGQNCEEPGFTTDDWNRNSGLHILGTLSGTFHIKAFDFDGWIRRIQILVDACCHDFVLCMFSMFTERQKQTPGMGDFHHPVGSAIAWMIRCEHIIIVIIISIILILTIIFLIIIIIQFILIILIIIVKILILTILWWCFFFSSSSESSSIIIIIVTHHHHLWMTPNKSPLYKVYVGVDS